MDAHLREGIGIQTHAHQLRRKLRLTCAATTLHDSSMQLSFFSNSNNFKIENKRKSSRIFLLCCLKKFSFNSRPADPDVRQAFLFHSDRQ